jgi:hypothetical protein
MLCLNLQEILTEISSGKPIILGGRRPPVQAQKQQSNHSRSSSGTDYSFICSSPVLFYLECDSLLLFSFCVLLFT